MPLNSNLDQLGKPLCKWEIYDQIIIRCTQPQKVQGIGRCACMSMKVLKRVKEGPMEIITMISLQGYIPGVTVRLHTSNQNWTVDVPGHILDVPGYCLYSSGGNPCLSTPQ